MPDLESPQQTTDWAAQLAEQVCAVRLILHRPGCSRKLTKTQRETAARAFTAEPAALSASKKLLGRGDKAAADCSVLVCRARQFWIGLTYPYPAIKGVRLIRKEHVEQFDRHLSGLRKELDAAAAVMVEELPALRERAAQRLGDLYDEADFNAAWAGGWDILWDYPSLEPPESLAKIAPEIYERQRQAVAAQIQSAADAAEAAFAAQLGELVAGLRDKLAGDPQTGEKRKLTARAADGFKSFFERVKTMQVTGNAALTAMIDQAQAMVDGLDIGVVKDPASVLRDTAAKEFGDLAANIDAMLERMPGRKIRFDEGED